MSLSMPDPRVARSSESRDVPLLAFYNPGRPTKWDELCGVGFLGNFESAPVVLLPPTADGEAVVFKNAEAAFQATKHWEYARVFAELSGDGAFALKGKLARDSKRGADWSYSGYGSNLSCMQAVLRAKFAPSSAMAVALLATGDAFLLEHCELGHRGLPRDVFWADGTFGSGKNWLGAQLMLHRDELRGGGAWTQFIHEAYGYDPTSAAGGAWPPSRSAEPSKAWQRAVTAASAIVVAALPDLKDHQRSLGPPPPTPHPTKTVQAADDSGLARTFSKVEEEGGGGGAAAAEAHAVRVAVAAMVRACCKHSKYQVGACLLTSDGRAFAGVNVESDSFGLTVCAERCALFKALSEGAGRGGGRFVALACSTRDAGISCGACRQMLAEYCPPAMPCVFTSGDGRVVHRTTVSDMLPDPFVLKQEG